MNSTRFVGKRYVDRLFKAFQSIVNRFEAMVLSVCEALHDFLCRMSILKRITVLRNKILQSIGGWPNNKCEKNVQCPSHHPTHCNNCIATKNARPKITIYKL